MEIQVLGDEHGNVVHCFLSATVDPTAGTAWSFTATLPFGVDVTAVTDIIGAVSVSAIASAGDVSGVIASDTALVAGLHDDSAQTANAVFAYRI